MKENDDFCYFYEWHWSFGYFSNGRNWLPFQWLLLTTKTVSFNGVGELYDIFFVKGICIIGVKWSMNAIYIRRAEKDIFQVEKTKKKRKQSGANGRDKKIGAKVTGEVKENNEEKENPLWHCCINETRHI